MLTGKRSDAGRLVLGLLALAARELAATLLVLAGAGLLLFLVLKAAPGDDFRQLRLGQSVETGLSAAPDEGVSFSEYLSWLGDAAKGDFGHSSSLQKGRHASELIWPSAGTSFLLLLVAMAFSVAIALPAALLRAYRPTSLSGRFLGGALTVFSSIPVFLYVYTMVAAGNRFLAWGASAGYWALPKWFPLPMTQALLPWLLCALVLAVGDGGALDLFQRFSGELHHAGSGEHIAGARVLGLSAKREIARGFIPGALAHLSRRVSFVLGSLVVLEATLGWPGIGYLAWRAASERDMPVLLGSALVMAAALRVALLGSRVAGYLADPRTRNS